MSLKTLAHRATAKVGRQVLTVRSHSPILLFGAGLVGVGTTAYLACRATLKLEDVLKEGEDASKKIDDELTDDGVISSEHPNGDEWLGRKFGVQLQTATKIARLYAPAVFVGVASVGALTGAHVILQRRNAALAAAYAVVDKSFKEYRGRVVDDQGKEKDFEYMHGVSEREIVEEGPNGPEVKTIKGLDQEAIKNANPESEYKRVFTRENKHWSDIPNQNQFFIQMIQSQVNDLLTLQGYVFLNTVYDLLGFKPTAAGQMLGWLKNPEEGKGDGWIDFGVWTEGVYKGKEWINGQKDAFLLDFNVDGVILGNLPRV